MPSPHSEHVLDQLDAQREWGFLCDVLVSIGDTQFRAHRAVLAACSAFFRMLFIQSDCRGQQSVDLSHTGLSAHSFDRVLQYMYQGRVTTTDRYYYHSTTAIHVPGEGHYYRQVPLP
uniref:BTB domain-containing protein n=1 Tax=Periophthalmus magnuspinnatus TaxID=409849 RepID=A0A3B4BB38_9GOBI